ncbi:TolC family protein [Pendulispora albinea]|uniref:TolC family protein n=1 Tax=Pendulispora albinea TaxID=2741071 RepID=A0ABZ2MAV1_9BACT
MRFRRWGGLARAIAGAMGAGVLSISGLAHALQPLETFLAGARATNPDNREAAATLRQRRAELDVATGRLLPSLTGQGTWVHNQYEAVFQAPTGESLTIQPKNQLDGYVTLAVPLVDVGAWMKRSAAKVSRDAAAASRDQTELTVERDVTRLYYQVLADEAVLASATKSFDTAEGNRKLVTDRRELGTASELDFQRAETDVAKASQDMATAGQSLVNDRRSLETLSGIDPEPGAGFPEDDLHEEAALAVWLGSGGEDLVAVRAAVLDTEAATKSRDAAKADWLPTLSAQAQNRFTNATGFAGRSSIYTIQATATWKLDFTLGPGVRAQNAAVDAAKAREDKTRRAAADAIYQAWNQVRAGIAKARAARAQVGAATLAADLARVRYGSGVATQLEVVQAQRDLFSAEVSRVQADSDLQYARALLRLSARRTGSSAGAGRRTATEESR